MSRSSDWESLLDRNPMFAKEMRLSRASLMNAFLGRLVPLFGDGTDNIHVPLAEFLGVTALIHDFAAKINVDHFFVVQLDQGNNLTRVFLLYL